jgi:hypothetical protein
VARRFVCAIAYIRWRRAAFSALAFDSASLARFFFSSYIPQDAPAFVPSEASKYPKNTTVVIREVLEEEHPSLDEDDDELKQREALAREEKRLQDEAVARAQAWEAGKKEAAETRRKAEEGERERKLKQAHSDAGVSDGKNAGPRPEADGVDEDGFPVYSPRKLDAMETGQIVIQFLKVEGVKPANLYLQAKLLSPTKQLLHETEVIKKTAPPDWSAWPPSIHNVKLSALSAPCAACRVC